MKFRFIKPVTQPVRSYNQTVRTGDVVEFTGRLIEKAIANPNWDPLPHAQPVEQPKRPRGRPRKVKPDGAY